jgi:hypothetical protein
MSVKNYAAQILFGAKQDGSVKSTIGKLKSEITSIGTTIAAQRKSLGDIGGLRAGQTRVSQAEEWLRGEQTRLRSVRREGSSRDIRQAEQGVRRATTELTRQRTALIALSAAARAAGVDTARLSEEERRLGDSIAALGTRQAALSETNAAHRRLGDSIANLRTRIGAAGSAFVNDSKRIAVGIGGIAAAAGVASLAIGGLVKSVEDDAGKVSDTAAALGITTAALQTWQYAASTVGVDAEQLGASFAKYQKNIDEGSDKTVDVLKKLGINHAYLAKQPLGRQLLMIAEGFKNYKGSMSKATMQQILFSKATYKMTGVLEGGVDLLNELHLQGITAGSVLTKEQLDGLNDVGAVFDYLGATVKGLKNLIGIALAPAVSQLAKAFTDLIDGNREEIKEWARKLGDTIRKDLVPHVKTLIEDFPRVTKAIGDTATKIWNGVKAVKDFVGGWDNLGIALVALNFAPTIAKLGGLIPVIWNTATAAWGLLGPWAFIGLAAVGAAKLIYDNWGDISESLNELKTSWVDAFTYLGDIVKSTLGPTFDWLSDRTDSVIEKIKIATGAKKASGLAALEPSWGQSSGAMAQLMPQGTLQSTISGRGTQNNTFNITVPAVQDGTDFGAKFRESLKQKSLYDEFGVLAPN